MRHSVNITRVVCLRYYNYIYGGKLNVIREY